MWIHRDVTIDVNSNGKFTAQHEDVDISGDTLEQVKTKIDAVLSAGAKKSISLKVVGLLYAESYKFKDETKEGTVAHGVLTGINCTSRVLQISGLPKGFTLKAIPDTPENLALLERYVKLSAELDEVSTRISKMDLRPGGYGRIARGPAYDAALKNLEKIYKLAAKGE